MKYFDESIVFVLSDHGHRYDSIRETVYLLFSLF